MCQNCNSEASVCRTPLSALILVILNFEDATSNILFYAKLQCSSPSPPRSLCLSLSDGNSLILGIMEGFPGWMYAMQVLALRKGDMQLKVVLYMLIHTTIQCPDNFPHSLQSVSLFFLAECMCNKAYEKISYLLHNTIHCLLCHFRLHMVLLVVLFPI